MSETILGIVAGTLLSLLISILIEYKRKPDLIIMLDRPISQTYENGPIKHSKFLKVLLRNKPMPKFFKWLGREAANHCSGSINFYDISNKAFLFSEDMSLRWSGSGEPFVIHRDATGKIVRKDIDFSKITSASYRDVFPGYSEPIDVVVRFDNDDECFGWSSESYLKGWKNKEWEIGKGIFIVKVTVISGGDKITEYYKLLNSSSIKNFRLEEISKTEKRDFVNSLYHE